MEAFDDKLEALIPHSFIAKQQSLYFNECKASLKLGEVLVQADFSENYSFVLQDAAQRYHWNNSSLCGLLQAHWGRVTPEFCCHFRESSPRYYCCIPISEDFVVLSERSASM